MNKAVRGIEAQLAGLNDQELRRLLIEHLSTRKLGLNWESSAIERDRALNSNIVLPRVNYAQSFPSVASAPYCNLVIEGDKLRRALPPSVDPCQSGGRHLHLSALQRG